MPRFSSRRNAGLRHALRALVDGRVGHRPVDRQAQVAPQVLERLLVLGRQPVAQLDEVRTRHGESAACGGFSGGGSRVVRQRRIAADAVVVLHAPLGRQAVVVPSHRIEHRLAAHALEARDDVGVRVGEHVADVQRAADRRRRRVDRSRCPRARGCDRSGRCPLPPTGHSTSPRVLRARAFREGLWDGCRQLRGTFLRILSISSRTSRSATVETISLTMVCIWSDEPSASR